MLESSAQVTCPDLPMVLICALEEWRCFEESPGSSLAFHEGRVRLSGGMECEGEVEVYFRQDWRRVLLDSWSESEASVVCRQLGCGSVFSFSRSSTSSPEHSDMCVTGFNCSGSEAHLGNCSSAQAVNCSSREQLSITCSGKFNSAHSSIRLEHTDCSHRQDAGVTCADISALSTTAFISTTTTFTTTVGQPAKITTTPSPAVLIIYPVSLLVLGAVLFLALVLLVVLFYQNRVLRRVLSKRRHKTLTEAVYEEIDRRYISKRNDSTQRGESILYDEQHSGYEDVEEELLSGSVLSDKQHSGYEDVDEELLSEKSLIGVKEEYYDDVTTSGLISETAKEDTVESYDDVITAGQISDSVAEDVAENYDDVITTDQSSAVETTEDVTDNYEDAVTAGPNSNIMTVDTLENYDDVITAGQGVGEVKDYDDVEEEPQTEKNHVTESSQPVSFLRKLHSNLFRLKK
ncbi:hypothetical protein AOLI_G00312290 [Acnodon oligacanthus]